MSLREKVARALVEDLPVELRRPGRTQFAQADRVIAVIFDHLAEPTDEMAEAWAAIAKARIQKYIKADNEDAPGAIEGAKESFRAMIAVGRQQAEADK